MRCILSVGILCFILSGCFLGTPPSYYPYAYSYPRYHTEVYTARDQAQDWARIREAQDAERVQRNIQRRLGNIEQRKRYRPLY